MTEDQVTYLHLAFTILSFVIACIIASKVYIVKRIEVKYPIILSLFVLGFLFVILAIITSIIIVPMYPIELSRG